MGIFGFKKKKKQPSIVSLPVKGKIIALSEVSDPAFAQGMMGPGFAVIPKEGVVVAPLKGTVTFIAPTGHAIGITSEDGADLLIHIGIDTVKFEGEGFIQLVQESDHVDSGQPIIKFDRDLFVSQGTDTSVMLVITNAADFSEISIELDDPQGHCLKYKK